MNFLKSATIKSFISIETFGGAGNAGLTKDEPNSTGGKYRTWKMADLRRLEFDGLKNAGPGK